MILTWVYSSSVYSVIWCRTLPTVLYGAMKIRGFLHLYIGEEAIAVGVMEALTPEDGVVATYREHGQALARGISAGAGAGRTPFPTPKTS